MTIVFNHYTKRGVFRNLAIHDVTPAIVTYPYTTPLPMMDIAVLDIGIRVVSNFYSCICIAIDFAAIHYHYGDFRK